MTQGLLPYIGVILPLLQGQAENLGRFKGVFIINK
jgi:hypothetical protein